MKIVNFTRWYKKSICRCYECVYKQLDAIDDPEEKVRLCICTCTLVCFSIGMICDIIGYVRSASYLLLSMNLWSLAIYAVTPVLYAWEKVGIPVALVILLFTVQLNIAVSILHNHFGMTEGGSPAFSHDLFIGFLVCILASLTIGKSYVYILCLLPLTTQAVSLTLTPTPWIFTHFMSLCLAYLSPPVLLTYIRKFMWDTFRKKDRLLSEQRSLRELMGMNEEQWNKVIEAIQKPHTSRQQTEKIMEKMHNAISDQLMIRAEHLLASEEVMERINEKHKLNLSAKDVRLCCLILEDKSIMEISNIFNINESSVRASRSRIRKKLKLEREMNLKAHLLMLVGEEI